jgi:MFS superfamily sulfate permease-like transporter
MIYKWIKYYSWTYIKDDAFAAMSLSTVIIPQSLAYAQLAKLPPVIGLYVSIIPPLIYTFLGNHPFTSIGTFAIVSIAIADTLSSVSIPEEDFVGFASFLAFLVGAMELLLSISGMIEILSKLLFKQSFISGFTAASVITIITSQFKPFFGLSFPSANNVCSVPKTWYLVITSLKNTNIATLSLSLSTIVLIRGSEFLETMIRKWIRMRKLQRMADTQNQARNEPQVNEQVNLYQDHTQEKIINMFPSVLFAFICLTFVSKLMDLQRNYGVLVLGDIPSGLSPFSWPWAVLSRINTDTFLIGQMIYRVLSLVIICTVTSASVMDLYPGSNPEKAQSSLSLHVLDSDEREEKGSKKNTLNQEVLALSIAGIFGIFVNINLRKFF